MIISPTPKGQIPFIIESLEAEIKALKRIAIKEAKEKIKELLGLIKLSTIKNPAPFKNAGLVEQGALAD